MSSVVKAHELRLLDKTELLKKLNDFKQELAALRVNQASSATAQKLSKISAVRKCIARVMTVIRQNQRSELRAIHAKSKHLPLDLRPKKTRAIRKRLTKHEQSIQTPRQMKKARNFPMKKFAILA